MQDLFALAVLITPVFILAGMVKGVLGMGLPTVAMGLLSLAVAPVQAAAIMVVPAFVTNLWQLMAGPRLRAIARRLATMMAGVGIGTLIGVEVLTGTGAELATAVLGLVLVVYGMQGLVSVPLTVAARHESWLSPLVGVCTGLITGATGVFVIPAVPYLSALGLEKDELVQALGLSFTVSTLALSVGLGLNGELAPVMAGISLLALLPALLGMVLGQRLREKLQPAVFRRWFFGGMIVIGAIMMLRTLGRLLN